MANHKAKYLKKMSGLQKMVEQMKQEKKALSMNLET